MANSEHSTEATPAYTRLLRSEAKCAPTYSKCFSVGVKLKGYDSTSALSTSTPYTSTISPASSKQLMKQARLTLVETGGRGMEPARPVTVTKLPPPLSRRNRTTYSARAIASRMQLTTAAPAK